MKSLKRLVVAVLMTATTLVVIVVLPRAASATAPLAIPGCAPKQNSANAWSVTCKPPGTWHGRYYKLMGTACGTNGVCKPAISSATAYGSLATISGAGPISSDSISVEWATTSTATNWCQFSAVGGLINWCDMQASINYWGSLHLPYCDGCALKTDWYKDANQYFSDCSGLVSMAWHLTADHDTDALASPTYSTRINAVNLQPGDALIALYGVHNLHHAVIFVKWNSDHTPGTLNGTFTDYSFGQGTFNTTTGSTRTYLTSDSFSNTIGYDSASWYSYTASSTKSPYPVAYRNVNYV